MRLAYKLLSKCLLPKMLSLVVFGPILCYGHEYPLHDLISSNAFLSSAAANTFLTNCGFSSLLFATPLQCAGTRSASGWLQQGSILEDIQSYGVKPTSLLRCPDHFYTVTPTRTVGAAPPLTDNSETGGLMALGLVNSFVWATQNGVSGPNYVVDAVGTNPYKWSDARNYEFAALTNSALTNRITNMAMSMYSLGHVLHLNQDLSSPDHVRNDAHPQKAYFEGYGLHHYMTNLQWFAPQPHGWPYWQSNGFGKLLDFWDRGIYVGTAGPLNNETNGTVKLGLSEFSNGNFLGEDATYFESVPISDPFHSFPLPSEVHSTQYPTIRKALQQHQFGTTIAGSFLHNGEQINRIYLIKYRDGLAVAHHSVFGYFDSVTITSTNSLIGETKIYAPQIGDDSVLQDYHSTLIPKAVEYSAGILDYFFRGTLSVGSFQQTNSAATFTITNTSIQALSGGGFHLFWDDYSGTRTELTGTSFSTTYTGSLVAGGAVNATFVPPPGAANCALVFSGTIGVDSSTNALDPVDANIAVATVNFQPPTSAVGGATLFSWLVGNYDTDSPDLWFMLAGFDSILPSPATLETPYSFQSGSGYFDGTWSFIWMPSAPIGIGNNQYIVDPNTDADTNWFYVPYSAWEVAFSNLAPPAGLDGTPMPVTFTFNNDWSFKDFDTFSPSNAIFNKDVLTYGGAPGLYRFGVITGLDIEFNSGATLNPGGKWAVAKMGHNAFTMKMSLLPSAKYYVDGDIYGGIQTGYVVDYDLGAPTIESTYVDGGSDGSGIGGTPIWFLEFVKSDGSQTININDLTYGSDGSVDFSAIFGTNSFFYPQVRFLAFDPNQHLEPYNSEYFLGGDLVSTFLDLFYVDPYLEMSRVN